MGGLGAPPRHPGQAINHKGRSAMPNFQSPTKSNFLSNIFQFYTEDVCTLKADPSMVGIIEVSA